ncbi:MAG: hypothetical protein IJA81_09060 [Akkermansia sp.]|nr:hypothetical protein [Akkermansia sp.]
MTTYDISDITDRLEDLDSYLDYLETALESAREARSDMAEYAEQIGTFCHLQHLVDTFTADPHLHADLAEYVAAHEPAMPERTARMFRTLLALLEYAELAAPEPPEPSFCNDGTLTLQLAVTPAELRTLLRAVRSELGRSPEHQPYHRELLAASSRLTALLEKLPAF